MSVEAMKAIQMVYANTTKHDWPDDIWEAICQAIAEAKKQEQGEPVACDGCNGNGVVGNILDTAECPFCQGTGIDTTPQPKRNVATPREPLTKEQILALWEDTYVQRGSTGIEFARAIEAAHGIKENT